MTLKSFFSTQIIKINSDLKQDLVHLILETLSVDRADLYSETYLLENQQILQLTKSIEALQNGKPLSYILKSQDFMGFKFMVDERVLIPRSETEYLVDMVLGLCKNEDLVLFDAGAGSGCIGISFLIHRKKSYCIFMEKSLEAIEVLKSNLSLNSISSDRFKIVKSFNEFENLFSGGEKFLDLFISNPPYIRVQDPRLDESVKKYEPEIALFAEDSGLYFLKKWSEKSKIYLKENGFAIFEFGQGQEEELKIFSNHKSFEFSIINDQYGCPRFWKLI